MFYHYLTIHKGQGFENRVIGSAAANIDEACRERSKIAAQFHPNTIAQLTTHNVGTGPVMVTADTPRPGTYC